MLSEAARLARLLAGLLDPAYRERGLRAVATMLMGYAVAAAMVLVAAVFALIALHQGLRTAMPAWAAALVMAAVAVIIAAIAILAARRARRRLGPPPPGRLPGELDHLASDPAATIAAAMAPLVDEVLAATRRKPGETVMLAVAAGMIVGRLLRRPPKRPPPAPSARG